MILKKVFRTLNSEIKNRGLYFAVLMNISYVVAAMRGTFFKILYFQNIRSSIFFLQSNSKLEVFNKKAGITIGKFVFMRKNVSIRIDGQGVLEIGEKTFINDNCNINCIHKVSIGKYTKIAPNVSINDHDHNYKASSTEHLLKGEVKIGNHVWIGSNVVILRDTVIGDHAVIAAGSVVKGNVPPHTLFVNKRESIYIDYAEKSS
ncbi:acyltransferase [Ectobacillus sp. JY-23]|uniref:acyltransferase n=1 Tax=Ectobacillus sp. JY-23 TaxID=2933872 RepID=UPI001FF5FC78|nr:acyltransferase [Ectobacillus sp. JY-23]UOY92698.1 acyltransferase [Ectobacillus sp. JY-23]